MLRKNDIDRILAERNILITVRNPFVVIYHYPFLSVRICAIKLFIFLFTLFVINVLLMKFPTLICSSFYFCWWRYFHLHFNFCELVMLSRLSYLRVYCTMTFRSCLVTTGSVFLFIHQQRPCLFGHGISEWRRFILFASKN